MPIITSTSFVSGVTPLVLDPVEVADDRVELQLNTGSIRVAEGGPDWGDGAIEQYLAEAERGQLPVAYRVPNRTITIPLILGADGPAGFATARSYLTSKVARIQDQGGWLKRGDTGLYADLTGASLRLPDRYGHQGAEIDVILTLEALPDFYGDEEELTVTDGVIAEVAGDYPGRVRIEVTDLSGEAQLGLLGGFRCRHYSDAATAQLEYAATDLEPLDAAAVAGSTVEHADLGTGWIPVLGTNIGGTDWMTHTGSYGVWAKLESDDGGDVQVRWVYDVGDLVLPEENLRRTIPGAGNTYLVYLGQMRLDRPPVGTHRWQGQVQARGAAGGEHVAARSLHFLPLDESPWKLRAPIVVPEGLVDYSARSGFYTESGDIAGDSLAVGGTWVETGDADGFSAAAGEATRTAVSDANTVSGGCFVTASGPTLATVVAQLSFKCSVLGTAGQCVLVRYVDTSNFLIAMAGTFPDGAGGSITTQAGVALIQVVGGTPELLGFVSLPSDQLADTFYSAQLFVDERGVAALWAEPGTGLRFVGDALVVQSDDLATGGALAAGDVGILDRQAAATANTRTYKNFAAWVPTLDAVIHPNQSCELRTEGFFREDASGIGWGPVSDPSGSDLPRIPPSGLEGRPVELFLLTSAGDLAQIPDGATADQTVTARYRPSYLFPQT